MTPQQKALLAELRAADYPATWKLSARAADDKLVGTGTESKRQRLPARTDDVVVDLL